MLRDSQVCAYVPVSNVDKGRRFYEGVLEMKPMETSDSGALYECAAGSHFFMYLSNGAGSSTASCLFWDVDDIEREVGELKDRGVMFERYDVAGMQMDGEIAIGGGAKAAWFKDPDGNILALIQQLAE